MIARHVIATLCLWVAIWCFSPVANALADGITYLSSDTGRVSLKGRFTYFEDKGGTLTINDVSKPSFNDKFKPVKVDLSKGYSSSAFWLRTTIATNEKYKDRRIIEVGPWALKNIDVFLTFDGVNFARKSAGYGIIHKYLDVEYRNPSFLFTLEPFKTYTLYIRLVSEQPITPRVTIWHQAVFSQLIQNEHLFMLLYVFVGIFIVVLNVCLWLTTRKKLYGLFTVYSIAIIIYFLNSRGIINQYIFPDIGWLTTPVRRLSMAAIIWLGANILVETLDLKKHLPKSAFALLLITNIIVSIGILLTLFNAEYLPGYLLYHTLTIGTFVCTLVPAWLAIKKVPISKVLLFAFGSMVFVFFVRLATSFDFCPDLKITDNLLSLSPLLHLILLNVGVSSRISLIEQEKEGLAKALEAERENVKMQKLFLRRIAHEIRTPLSIIDSAAQVMPLMSDEPDEMLEMADSMRSASLRLVNLTNNILASQDVVKQGLQADMKPHKIKAIMEAAIKKAQSATKSHQVTAQIDSTIPEYLVCDGLMIEALISNLLDNAIKYSPDKPEIQFNACHRNNCLVFEIVDHGIGISPDQQEKIYDRYYRADQVAGLPGVGLGLYVAKQIVDIHKGSISCTSSPNNGTTFIVKLPLS